MHRPVAAMLALALAANALLCSSGAARAQAQDVAAFLAGRSKDCPGCDLSGAKLKRRDLTGANLAGANLSEASLHRSLLRGANLAGADLTGSNLNKTTLLQANLSRAKMKGAMLFEAE